MQRLLFAILALGILILAPRGALAATPASDPTATPDVFHAPALTTATAQCHDGWFSYSRTRGGTCDGHGGVMLWIADPGDGQPPSSGPSAVAPPPVLPPDAGLSIHVPPPGAIPPFNLQLLEVPNIPFPPVFEPPYPITGPSPSFSGGNVCGTDEITVFALSFCSVLLGNSSLTSLNNGAITAFTPPWIAGGNNIILATSGFGCISFSGGPCITRCADGTFSSSLPFAGVCALHGGIAP